MVRFDKEKHQYFNKENGDQLISVTTLLGKYKKESHSLGTFQNKA